MKRLTPLPVAAALVVTALAAALVAAGSGGASAASRATAARPAGAFRQALAAKLGEQLHKPATDVLAAMKTANRARLAAAGRTGAGKAGRRARRAARLTALAERLTTRADALRTRASRLAGRPGAGRLGAGNRAARQAQRARRAHRARDAWAAALAKPLHVSASDVTAALRALVAERLGSLVSEGWITSDRRDAALACFDDAAKCQGIRTPGVALLRAGL
jgi:hypothetical protein